MLTHKPYIIIFLSLISGSIKCISHTNTWNHTQKKGASGYLLLWLPTTYQPFFVCVAAVCVCVCVCVWDDWPSAGRRRIAESCLSEPSSSWRPRLASSALPPAPSAPFLPAAQIVRDGQWKWKKQTNKKKKLTIPISPRLFNFWTKYWWQNLSSNYTSSQNWRISLHLELCSGPPGKFKASIEFSGLQRLLGVTSGSLAANCGTVFTS